MRSNRPVSSATRTRADRTPATSTDARALQIVVLGAGRTGLVLAGGMARFGHQVTLVDIDAALMAGLQRGEMPVHEAGLAELLSVEAEQGRLQLKQDAAAALPSADIVFIATPVPTGSDGSTSLRPLEELLRKTGALLPASVIVVLGAGVPVGTARHAQDVLAQALTPGPVPTVLSNPSFLRAGTALQDFLTPDRVLIGHAPGQESAAERLLQAYQPLIEQGVPVLTMDTNSAELTRLAANAMLATRVSFINEIAAIAAATGADIAQVCAGIGSDARIGPDFLRPGAGYGGHSLPIDLAALRHTARQHSLRSDVLHATERVNGRQRSWAFDALQRDLGSSAAMRGLRVAVWGLAFKPGTDDMRESPSLALIERLTRAGVLLQLFDPAAMTTARTLLPPDRRTTWATSAEAALENADALMLVTEWPEFLAFDPAAIASALRLRVVYDGRNALDPVACAAASLRLVQVGRPDVGRRAGVPRDMVPAVPPISTPQQPTSATHYAALAAALR